MVNEVLSSQTVSLRAAAAQASRSPVDKSVVMAADAAPPASSGKDLPSPPPEPVDLSRVVENLNRFMESSQRNLSFRVDETSGRTIITVVNPETNEVVRQIPPDELLALARSMAQNMREAGNLFDALA